MATVRERQIKRSGIHSKKDIIETIRPVFARDDLSEAFAGNENNGPAHRLKSSRHSTNVKSRKSKHSKTKTPIR